MTATMTVRVEWDTTTDEYPGGDPAGDNLPTLVEVPLDVSDVAEWLSDQYGWLVRSCELRWEA